MIARGLGPLEQKLLKYIPLKQGRLLILGLGGGREALAFARMGFEVVGVDYIEDMVAKMKENAAKLGLKVQGLVQEISNLEMPPHSFDLAVLFAAMYSMIPTRKRRVEVLRRIHRCLKPGGYLLCLFYLNTGVSHRFMLVRKAIAFFTLGNFWYEAGDLVWGSEFLHAFSRLTELEAEFAEGGFEDISFVDVQSPGFVGAVLRRPH